MGSVFGWPENKNTAVFEQAVTRARSRGEDASSNYQLSNLVKLPKTRVRMQKNIGYRRNFQNCRRIKNSKLRVWMV